MAYLAKQRVLAADSPSVDAFSRWRVSQPQGIFDGQFTYNLLPLQFEQITNGSGASVAHDATNRAALMTFSSTTTGGKAYMQSYEYIRYQPGKSQAIFVTFNFIEAVANCLKFAGYSDWGGTGAGVGNGVEFQLNGTTKQWTIYSDTTNGDETVTQTNWNLDKLDGTGNSGITLDITKTQIAVIDLQALYVGRVRVGFDIEGSVVYCHEFNHANLIAYPYIQNASRPIKCGMTCSGTVSTTMLFICSAVSSEGGQEEAGGLTTAISTAVISAASGTDTHFISLRPLTTFNSIVNRVKFVPESVDAVVTGNYPIQWKLCIGQAITGGTWASVNTTYSAFEANVTATLSSTPALVIQQGFVASSNQSRGSINARITNRFPISLSAAGAVRANGTLTLMAQGLGGGSNTYMSMNWREIR